MHADIVSVKHFSRMVGLDRSAALRYLKRVGIRPRKRRMPDSGNQLAATITRAEADAVIRMREEGGFVGPDGRASDPPEDGFFYAIQLTPDLKPGRIKLGFAARVDERLQQHRTAAPTAIVLQTWPCRRAWERAAIDAATRGGCQAVGVEVFDFEDTGDLIASADAFFAAMPAPSDSVPLSPHSPLADRGDISMGAIGSGPDPLVA